MDFTQTFTGRPNTIRTYKSLYNRWIVPHSENMNENSIYELIDIWNKADIAPKTIRILVRLLKWYLEYRGIDTSNIAKVAKTINKNTKTTPEIRALTKSQAQELLEVCRREQPEFYPVLLLGLHAGLRRGEVFGLTVADIDFIKGRIFVRRSYDGPTKNGQSRAVPITAELEKVLVKRYNVGERGDRKLFQKFDPNPMLTFLCRKSGIPRISFHGLRHTFASILLESGTSPRIVQDLLGHTDLNITFSYYWSNIASTPDLSSVLP